MPLDLIRRTPSPSNPSQNTLKLPSFKRKSISTADLRIEEKGFDDLSARDPVDNNSVLSSARKIGTKCNSTIDLSSTDKLLMDRNYIVPSNRIQVNRPTSSLSASPPSTK